MNLFDWIDHLFNGPLVQVHERRTRWPEGDPVHVSPARRLKPPAAPYRGESVMPAVQAAMTRAMNARGSDARGGGLTTAHLRRAMMDQNGRLVTFEGRGYGEEVPATGYPKQIPGDRRTRR